MSARPALSAILGLFVVYALLSGGLLLRQAEAMRRADLAVQAIQAEAARAADLAHHARNLLDPTLNRAEEAARFSAMLRGFRAGRTEAARAAIPGGSGRNPGRDPGRDPDPGLAPGADAAAAAALADLLRAATALAALAPPAPQARSGPAAVAPAGSRAPASGPAPAAAGPTARPHEATAYRADAEALARRIEDAAHALADAYDLRRRQGRLHADAAAARMRRTAAAAGAGGVLLALALGRFGLAPLARRLSARTAALERRLAQAREEATRDPATGLPNLRGARERLTGLMGADARPAVLRLALDHSGSGAFAGRGPLSSDRPVPALRAAARRLRALLRPGELLTRVGEREFAVLIAHVAAPSQAEAAARRLIEAMGEAVVEEGESLRFPVRAGVAVAARGDGDPDALLSDAELALAETMRGGGAPRAVTYAPAIRRAQEARALIAAEFAGALSREEVTPFFQPQVDLRSGALIGFESLVRWRHPVRGVLGPAEFVPIAEETGQIERMGDAVMRGSLAALAEWRNLGLGVHHVALNVSARELRDPALADKLAWDVDAAGLSPRNVALEVLESVLVENDEDPAIRTVAALAAAGFSVELDDFGTGHASIANLQKMQVHRIKIDRGFVTGLDRRAESRKIVGGIVGLASSLSIQTLAEGVETAAEAAAARDLGCELAQGFFIGRPMPREAAERWIRAWTPAAFVAELNRAATAASARPEDEAEAEATSGALAAAQPSEPPGPSARRRHG